MARAPKRAAAIRRRRRLLRRRAIPDSQQLAGIKQGVGRAVARAFGGVVARRGKRGGRRGGMMYNCCHHDAFHMSHLPLPRPTGPYTVIRTTQLIKSGAPLMLFGPTWKQSNSAWTNICAYSCVDRTKTFGDSGNTYLWTFDTLRASTWNAAQITPAAFSVQVMNPQALQTTTGIVYAGRVRTSWKITDNIGSTGDSVANQLISYNMPRLLAAAKLAFRGTQTDAVPYNMSRLADFTVHDNYTNGSTAATNAIPDFAGFNPQFYFNPDGLELQFLVCCEWRVRFDPSNPAQASHVQYSHAEESIWMKALHAAEAAGNGVIDIADRVAQTGNAVFNASAGAYRAARGMRALTNGVGMLALA